MTPELRKAFAANRRPVKSPGYWRPASLALQWARRDCPSWKAEAWRDGYAEGQL